MSFAQRLDVWQTLTARPADLADEVPGLAELRGELAAILEEVLGANLTFDNAGAGVPPPW